MSQAGTRGPVDANCIFCKIGSGEIPSYKIYEDEVVFAFMDIGPIVRGHCLVIPKAHYPTIMTTPPEVLAAVNARLPKISRALLMATGAPACHILANNGEQAMQTVPHIHYHILPRKDHDGFEIRWRAGKIDTSEASHMVAAAIEHLKGEN